ncbi:putative Zn(II)2Cys6 transcription factor [Pyrenochaeta sp. MPI-SDFR-AT-0127]|nr:putative Zn(II)2Cys6 transcription factor [Pyrenochaeta sp. MPI-SDFR-AT-0127]
MPVSSAGNAVTQRRRRAVEACKSCHARKVRCSLAHTGSPCINCTVDQLKCEPWVTKRRRTRPGRASNQVEASVSSPTNIATASQHRILRSRDSPFNSGTTTTVAPVANNGDDDGAETPYRPLAEHFSHYGGQSNNDALQSTDDVPENQYAPIYGDPRGVSLVADICEPQRRDKSGHLLVPRIRPPNVDSETLNYLQLRGVFDLPNQNACEMLIRAYFHYVHPFFPVVDAKSFIEQFENSRHEMSLHLLWGMFVAAANFADDATLKAAGYLSRKELKRSMYIKAKALYDAEYERNKIALIQAVLLMGFWYADTEDRTGPWHWNGVAISLSQTIGLHRNPDISSGHMRSISEVDRRLWQQLWWSCFYREAWFSAGMGRPMRIHLADCNTTMPGAEEAEDQLESLPVHLRAKYLPEGLRDIAKLWTQLLKLTVLLSNILLQQQRPEQIFSTEAEVLYVESQIRGCSKQHDGDAVHQRTNLVALYKYHFELYVESVILMLYRPFLVPDSAELSSRDWRSTVDQKTRSAAATTNQILSSMISADMIHVCQSIICIALVPALQIHLLDYTSSKPMIQRMGLQHLELCMIVIEELRKTLFGAEILYRMFTKAQKQIRDQKHSIAPPAPITPGNEFLTLSESTAIDLLADISRDEGQSHENEFDALSAIWNSGAPMTSFDFLDDCDLLWYNP